MIKNFENYSKRQRLANGTTQWQKKFDDGTTALYVIDDRCITRLKVINAFREQEYIEYFKIGKQIA